jgi:hypothetical protein
MARALGTGMSHRPETVLIRMGPGGLTPRSPGLRVGPRQCLAAPAADRHGWSSPGHPYCTTSVKLSRITLYERAWFHLRRPRTRGLAREGRSHHREGGWRRRSRAPAHLQSGTVHHCVCHAGGARFSARRRSQVCRPPAHLLPQSRPTILCPAHPRGDVYDDPVHPRGNRRGARNRLHR